MKLEAIAKGALISGIEEGKVVRVVSVDPLGDNAMTVIYKSDDGRLGERVVFRGDESKLSLATAGLPWGFDADGADFKLAAEAYRINLAHLFDPMMAIHTSNVDPLPHQITAVYESMLPRQPLRYVLADDPGAGKTIMAGLLIRELLMRADAARILIVSPGSLVEQWQDELYEKFGLEFALFSRDLEQQSRGGNAFEDNPLMVARLDQLSRADDLQEKLENTRWDLIVVDEAHKLSATWYGAKVNETKRFKLGKLLGGITRHFLLMTATPHNGKEEDFQLFMSLLDSDRFYGKFRDGAHKVDVNDMMRRMVKEDLLKFDGTPLFPERRAYTVNYQLSQAESNLYTEVRLGMKLLAVVVEAKGGRAYLPPTEEVEHLAKTATPQWVPSGDIPAKLSGGTCVPYGMTEWGHLFTQRQLVGLNAFSEQLSILHARIRADAIEAGWTDDVASLADNGSGATAYADALSVYLAFAVDRCADFSNTCTRWVPGNQKVMNLFAKQSIAMTWDFPEANIMVDTVGGFVPAANYVADCVEKLPLRATPVGRAKSPTRGRVKIPHLLTA